MKFWEMTETVCVERVDMTCMNVRLAGVTTGGLLTFCVVTPVEDVIASCFVLQLHNTKHRNEIQRCRALRRVDCKVFQSQSRMGRCVIVAASNPITTRDL